MEKKRRNQAGDSFSLRWLRLIMWKLVPGDGEKWTDWKEKIRWSVRAVVLVEGECSGRSEGDCCVVK